MNMAIKIFSLGATRNELNRAISVMVSCLVLQLSSKRGLAFPPPLPSYENPG